jgi:hypothetical protein
MLMFKDGVLDLLLTLRLVNLRQDKLTEKISLLFLSLKNILVKEQLFIGEELNLLPEPALLIFLKKICLFKIIFYTFVTLFTKKRLNKTWRKRM